MELVDLLESLGKQDTQCLSYVQCSPRLWNQKLGIEFIILLQNAGAIMKQEILDLVGRRQSPEPGRREPLTESDRSSEELI